jgi:hypothetical protein
MDGNMSDRLRAVIAYDPITGLLTREGRPLTGTNGAGYIQLTVDHQFYYGHRLAWWLHYGEWPPGEIDHINGNPSDNRIANLRIATRLQQTANARKRRAGPKGAFRFKRGPKWTAQIRHEGIKHHLGVFDDERSAHEAYCEAARRLKGEYARLD